MQDKPVLGRKPRPILTIGVDCGSLTPSEEREKTGVANVVRLMLANLAKVDDKNQYLFYHFGSFPQSILKLFSGRAKAIRLPRPGFHKIWLNLYFRMNKPDVFLATSQAIFDITIPTLGFVYDIAFMKYPELYKNNQELYLNTQKLVSFAKHIITISEFTKIDLISAFHINSDFISVCYPGIDKIFTPSGTKFVDTQPFFLYVGALKQTKNIPRIIKAFDLFLKQSLKSHRLILVGNDKDMDPKIKQTIIKLNLQKKVLIKGYVSRQNLPKYYRGAVAMITPALYEGFGLPIAEAMACGTTVIAGNNSSMQEIVQNAGILVDVENTNQIAEAMQKISDDEKLRNKYIRMSAKQIHKFDAEKFAKSVLKAVYRYCTI